MKSKNLLKVRWKKAHQLGDVLMKPVLMLSWPIIQFVLSVSLSFFDFWSKILCKILHAQLYKYFDTIISKISLLFPKKI